MILKTLPTPDEVKQIAASGKYRVLLVSCKIFSYSS